MRQFIYSFLIFLVISSNLYSQEINPKEVTGLKVNKVLEHRNHKMGDGSTYYESDTVVAGFSVITGSTEKYYGLREFGSYKKLLLECTIGHDISHNYAKKAVRAKITRRASWLVAIGGAIPFLLTFYDGPNFENQAMRWTGATFMFAGIISIYSFEKIFEKRIEKTCINF
jgi:hypothetical protein